MPVPDFQSLMLPVLRLASEGETRVPDIEDKLADEFGLSVEERDQLLPSGKRLLPNRIHWAKSYMVRAGLIDQPRRGRFIASQEGRALLARHPDKINVELLLEYPSFREWKNGGDEELVGGSPAQEPASIGSPVSKTPEEQIESAHATLHSALREDLLQRILQNSPGFFEQVIVELLVAMGYGGSRRNAATQLGRSGDGGVDGVINEDRLGLDRVYVQAKRNAPTQSVGRPDVQGFVGSLVGLGATKGVFVTTSSFSHQSLEYVRHLTQRIILIDGKRLADLMIEHNVGVRLNRAIEFKRLDEDFFAEDD
jgi:restriction system protein